MDQTPTLIHDEKSAYQELAFDYFWGRYAPHFALHAPHRPLQAPHRCVAAQAEHLRAPHIIEQPPSAAVVTTAAAKERVSVEDSEFMVDS